VLDGTILYGDLLHGRELPKRSAHVTSLTGLCDRGKQACKSGSGPPLRAGSRPHWQKGLRADQFTAGSRKLQVSVDARGLRITITGKAHDTQGTAMLLCYLTPHGCAADRTEGAAPARAGLHARAKSEFRTP
jgi:hypothetical protein